jgi:hypothetical protein
MGEGSVALYTILFRRSRWLIIDDNFVLWLLHRAIVGDVADVLEAQIVSIIRVEGFRFFFK